MDSPAHLQETALLDYSAPAIQELVRSRGWRAMSEFDRAGSIYEFVRDGIAFGYNAGDELPASRVLADGIGQCNTKAALLMALLRASGVACRLHGFSIDKALQRGAATGIFYALAPRDIIHSWVEARVDGRWIELEGVILDMPYLRALQRAFAGRDRAFCGYGAATKNLRSPGVEWTGADTHIQKEGINRDFGLFDDPDSFYAARGGNLSGAKRWLFERVARHAMNRNVARMRASAGAPRPWVAPGLHL